MKQSGFLAMPWIWIAVGVALLAATGWAMWERHGRQAERARAESLEAAVQTYAGLLEQRDEVIRKQNAAVEKLKTDAAKLMATTRAAVAQAQKEAKSQADEAARLRAKLGESDTLSCEAGIAEVKLGLAP